MSSFRFIRGSRGKSRVKCRGRVRAVAHSDIVVYKYIFVIPGEKNFCSKLAICRAWTIDRSDTDSGQVRQQVHAGNDDEEVCSMTKIRCRICELLGEDQGLNHGLSHPCHLTNLNHLRPGLNYSPLPNMNYLNHGLLNGLYLPQLKDMMLAAYLLRGNDQRQDICRAQRETRDFYSVWIVLFYSVREFYLLTRNMAVCIIICGICSKEDTR